MEVYTVASSDVCRPDKTASKVYEAARETEMRKISIANRPRLAGVSTPYGTEGTMVEEK